MKETTQQANVMDDTERLVFLGWAILADLLAAWWVTSLVFSGVVTVPNQLIVPADRVWQDLTSP